MIQKGVRLQVFPELASTSWRWRVVRNGKITASSGESFTKKQNAARALGALYKSLSGEEMPSYEVMKTGQGLGRANIQKYVPVMYKVGNLWTSQ